MCGPFTQKRTLREYSAIFKALPSVYDWDPRYNLSPGQQALTVRKTEAQSQPELIPLLWGLPPRWTKEKEKYSR